MRNGIVIPCYNESNRLDFQAFQAFINQNPDYVLCFVNDGSQDDTLKHLMSFCEDQKERVKVINLEQNQGKAEAVRRGINFLLKIYEVENVGFIDADLSTGFEDLKFLVSNLDDCRDDRSMVFGSRKMEESENIERSKMRNLASNIVGYSIQKMIGLPISDTQCGAKVFKKSLAEIVFKRRFMTRWLFDVEIFFRMKLLFGFSTMDYARELPLQAWRDVEGSKLNLIDSVKIPMMLSKIAISYKTFQRAA